MKRINSKMFGYLLVCGMYHLSSQSAYGQSLGSTKGNSLQINTMSGSTANNFMNRSWLLRDANGSDWLTARLHDGISIDASFQAPGSDTRTWWERDPYHNIQSWGSAGAAYLTIDNGKVGIGTISPASKLHVEEASTNGWLITSKAFSPTAGQINGIKLISGYPTEYYKWAGIASVAENEHSNNTGLALYAGQSERIRIAHGGNVGIGTTSPNVKLAVNGNIRAREVKVETANWPDYVFGEGYQLPDLKELSAYIRENRHLPGMPSAREAEAEGIDLGEMNRKLLEKVEELTLLLIEQQRNHDKEIQGIKRELAENKYR